MQSLIELKNISFSVVSKETNGKLFNKIILQDISFDVSEFSIVGIVGNSGCGKTTLAKILCGIIKNYSGQIIFNFNHRKKGANPIQLLFQNSAELINPLRKVENIFYESLEINKDYGTLRGIDEILQILNLPKSILGKYCFQLSGGERQRVALGRVLAVEPEILILDEPFSAQDIESQVNLYNILLELRKKTNVTILCISHNLKLLDKFTDEIIVMREGKIVEIGETKKIIQAPSNEYTKFFIKSALLTLNLEDFS